MVGGLNIDGTASKRRNVLHEANVAHELREPGPHGKSVEFAQERGMMEADPADGASFNCIRKRSGRRGWPVVGRVVKLDEKLIVRKIRVIDEFRVLDVVDGEVIRNGFLL